tara:strand:+ start:3312 stop:3554 length:243 start_codon:yes stop_codon:yes gene_type:complete
MIKFVSRTQFNQPDVFIEADDVNHLLKSRYFHSYTSNGRCEIIYDEDAIDGLHNVKVRAITLSKDAYPAVAVVIGWISHE